VGWCVVDDWLLLLLAFNDPCVLAGTRRCRLHLGALTILAQLPGGYPRVLFCRSVPYTAIAAPPGPTAIIRGLPSHRGSAMGYCLGPVPGGGLSLRGGCGVAPLSQGLGVRAAP